MSRNTNVARTVLMIALMVVLVGAGIGIGYGIGTSVPVVSQASNATSSSSSSSSEASNSSAPYTVTLVITTGNTFNSTVGEQPAYYVVGPDGLQSSAQIYLPAHRLIKLVIVNYDDGSANLSKQEYANVAGTVNNQITVVNNTMMNSTMGASGIQIRGAEAVSSLPASVIAHTFTIPSLGINIPVATLSTVVAYFTVNSSGTYSWFCMTACGSGSNGLGGAMKTPGWMTGSVVVQ